MPRHHDRVGAFRRSEAGSGGAAPRLPPYPPAIARWIGRLDDWDFIATEWMRRHGHLTERTLLGLLFLWFGLLKVFGYKSATSLIAQTIYWGDPETMVVVLGLWEVAMGLCLMWQPLLRVGLLLLFVRLPGTFLALVLQSDVCFLDSLLVPTVAGQYLIKDLFLFGAALIMGSTVRGSRSGAARQRCPGRSG